MLHVSLLLKPAAENTKVYIDRDGVIFDASLNQSQVAKNANKVVTALAIGSLHSLADYYYPVLPATASAKW